MATATSQQPAVRTYENDEDELIVEVELPEGSRDVELELKEDVLKVSVPLGHRAERHWWHPDATPC